MPRRRAVVELSASRLELAVLEGSRIVASRAERLSISDFNETWPAGVDLLVSRLKSLVAATGAAGLPATISYHAPTAAVIVSPVPAATAAKEALQAAKLALADAANRPLPEHPHDLERLWIDAEPAKTTTGDVPAQNAHVLGIAESEESAAALSRMAKEAGLRPSSLIPAECFSFIAAVDSVLDRSKASGKTCVALFCGEHTSVLAAATAGRLRFVRRIGLGSEMLVDALAREIKTGAPDAAPLTLDRAAASAVLFRCGIPVRGQPYDAQTGLTSDAVLPLVQPVLQRCLIEIKQTLRFGLDESERSGAKLLGLGLGAHIGRLITLFAEQTGLSAEPIEAVTGDSLPTSSTHGPIACYAAGRQFKLHLLPSSLSAEFTARRVKRGMYVGFAGAAAMVAFAAVDARMQLPKQLQRVSAAQTQLEGAKPVMELNSKLVSGQASVANANQRIRARLQDYAPWDAMMAVLSKSTPPGVKINDASMSFDGHKPVCRITGQTLPSQTDSNAALRAYLDALAAVPLVQSTRLGATQRGESDQGPIQSFEMTITLYELPSEPVKPSASLANVITEESQR